VVAVIVVAVLLVGELAARSVAADLPPHRGAEQEVDVKADQIRDHGRVDVVFAGASTADVGLDPTTFAAASQRYRTSYNAGLKGMPISVQPAWLRFVKDQLHPKVIVLDLQPTQLVLAKGTLARDYQLQVASFTGWVDRAAGGAGADVQAAVAKRSTLVRDRSDLRRPSQAARAAVDALEGKGAEPLIDADTREFVERNTDADGRDLEYRAVPGQLDLDPGGAQAFGAALRQGIELGDTRLALRQIERLGVPVVLTVLPIDVATLSRLGMSKAAYERAVAAIRSLATELDLPLVEFPELTDPGLYHDKVHLAEPGAVAATKILAGRLDALRP
jgi:hypothetical protein